MENELFEKRVLFESLSQILENQKEIMRHLGITKCYEEWGYDDRVTREIIEQCDEIIWDIRREQERREQED